MSFETQAWRLLENAVAFFLRLWLELHLRSPSICSSYGWCWLMLDDVSIIGIFKKNKKSCKSAPGQSFNVSAFCFPFLFFWWRFILSGNIQTRPEFQYSYYQVIPPEVVEGLFAVCRSGDFDLANKEVNNIIAEGYPASLLLSQVTLLLFVLMVQHSRQCLYIIYSLLI